jgi:hypothetical protein
MRVSYEYWLCVRLGSRCLISRSAAGGGGDKFIHTSSRTYAVCGTMAIFPGVNEIIKCSIFLYQIRTFENFLLSYEKLHGDFDPSPTGILLREVCLSVIKYNNNPLHCTTITLYTIQQ